MPTFVKGYMTKKGKVVKAFTRKDLGNFKGTTSQISTILKQHGASLSIGHKIVRKETGRMTDAFVQNRYDVKQKVFKVTHAGKTHEVKTLNDLRSLAYGIVPREK